MDPLNCVRQERVCMIFSAPSLLSSRVFITLSLEEFLVSLRDSFWLGRPLVIPFHLDSRLKWFTSAAIP